MTEWRRIDGFDDYEVSVDGRVRSWRKRGPGKERRATPLELKLRNVDGYRLVTVRSDTESRQVLVQALVLEAWVGPRPNGMQVAHRNGDRSDNRLSNLRWATKAENEADKKDHGTVPLGENHHGSKLTNSIVREIRTGADAGASFRSLARKYGVCHKTVSLIHARKAWAHVPEDPMIAAEVSV